ncbi:Aste57867_22890 [Aphanomyces stellatus]|uniref:Aste57867_22890 protein n=1 Tax=Aphanomyces stellatus TaxID=120398 RepID=A0A485LLS3_9STRA|nr:hypothetical protein As57867_022819 [Aphanomyces stellatus]VFT99540.1 Aste57867_22890 [Aphanomyces stellatus]
MSSIILNNPAPDFDIVDLETGLTSSFSTIAENGKPSVVMFYATWCNSCIPAVEEFEMWSKHNIPTPYINFVLINVDKHIGNAIKFVSEPNLKTKKPRVCTEYRGDGDMPTVIHVGCEDIPEGYGVHVVPHKMVLDQNGIVVRNVDDFHWDDIAGLFKHRFEADNQCHWTPFLFQETMAALGGGEQKVN